MERARWKRQQASRWDDRRVQTYAEYGYAVKNVFLLCKRMAVYRGLDTTGDTTINPANALDELARLATERTAKWESVLLLGNPETIAAARAWHRLIWHMELFARGERTDGSEWTALLSDVDAARARFYEAARQDLGIKSGRIPTADPWERPTQLVGLGETATGTATDAN